MSNKLSLYDQATKSSLENAEQWIRDAKLLIENSSFGHASALLRFACEEFAKTYVCWLTSEEMLPIDNEVVEDVFRSHRVKNEVIVGLLSTLGWMNNTASFCKRLMASSEPSKEQIVEACKEFEAILDSTEKMRQKAIYVSLNLERKEVETPLTIDEKEVKGVLEATEIFLKIVRSCVEEFPEKDKERWREIFSSIPREAWKTGEIPSELFRK